MARYPPSWLMIPHRRGSVSTIVDHDTPPPWLAIHRRAHDTPPSWLMIPHRRGSVSTIVDHMIPHRRGSVSTVVAHDTPPSWLMILHRRGLVSTIVARYPPSWLGTLYPGCEASHGKFTDPVQLSAFHYLTAS